MPLLDLVRHGETEVPGLLLGRTDIALSEFGWQQFEQQTKSGTWQSVVTSPLRRAREPAEKLALLRHLPLRIDADWAEIDFGRWDGRPLAELRADPVVSKQLDAFYSCAAAHGPPEGEAWSALRSRVARALLRLLDAPASERVLVSTHAGPIRAVLSAACDMPFERTWAFRIAHGTRLTLRVEHQDDGRPWGEIIEIAQP
jgi:alpha-ribazole phosphatase